MGGVICPLVCPALPPSFLQTTVHPSSGGPAGAGSLALLRRGTGPGWCVKERRRLVFAFPVLPPSGFPAGAMGGSLLTLCTLRVLVPSAAFLPAPIPSAFKVQEKRGLLVGQWLRFLQGHGFDPWVQELRSEMPQAEKKKENKRERKVSFLWQASCDTPGATQRSPRDLPFLLWATTPLRI